MNDQPPKTNGMGSLLSTLATGDNFSKMMMVIIIILTGGVNFLKIGSDGKDTREEIAAERALAVRQIKTIYNNQKLWVEALKAQRADHDALLKKLGLEPSKIPTPPPVQEPPEDEQQQ